MAKSRAVVRYRSRRVVTKRRRKAGMTLPVAVIAGFTPLLGQALYGYKTGRGLEGIGHYTLASLTGFDSSNGSFSMARMNNGLFPILGGLLVHKLAGKLGVNRALANAHIPFIRI
jgi:hypothetical protein